MSTNQIMSKIEALLDWEKIMEEAKAEVETLRDEIKQEICGTFFICGLNEDDFAPLLQSRPLSTVTYSIARKCSSGMVPI